MTNNRLIILPLLLFSLLLQGFTLRLNPRLGASYSWNDYSTTDTARNLFDAGFSGGVIVEAAFNSIFGVKAGLNLKNCAFRSKLYIQETSGFPVINLMYAEENSDKLMLEIPVSAVFYAGLDESLTLYAGAGVKPALVLMNKYTLVNEDPANTIYDSSGEDITEPMHFGVTAEFGIKMQAGPGTIDTGLNFTLYFTGNELYDRFYDAEITAGYSIPVL